MGLHFIAALLLFSSLAYPVTHWDGVELATQALYSRSLTDKEKGTVLVFVSSHCPCSVSHEPKLRALAKRFEDYLFLGIHANAGEADAAQHFAKNPLGFSVLDDRGGQLADRYGALKTPHAFIISRRGEVVFSGGVDDSHDTNRAKVHYLEDALTALQKGQKPPVQHARAVGCAIERKERLP